MNCYEPNCNKVYILKKSGRSKNPCKICFKSVTKRNGVQCKGACQKWVHFHCLGFTPGKVQDIKAGLITIICPCPDCSSEPKEISINSPTTCPETNSPAKKFPKSLECAKKKGNGSLLPLLECKCMNPLPPPPKCLNSRAKPLPSKICNVMPAQVSKSCSCLCGSGGNTECVGCKCGGRKPVSQNPQYSGSFSSDYQLCKSGSMYHSMANTLEQMCKTVTNLSEQIQLIICRLGSK